MKRSKKALYKFLVFTLAILVSLGMVNVKAGYTYDSKGEPIYSTDGFTVNETPYTYSSLGIDVGSVNPAPADMFVYNLQDPIIKDELDPQVIYLTDSELNAVYVFDTNFKLMHEIRKVRLYPNEYKQNYNNITSIKTLDINSSTENAKIMFPNDASVPTDEELNDPNGAYGGKGYAELYLYAPTCVYRAVIPSTGQDLIYVCDKGNNQVVVIDYNTFDGETYEVIQVLTKPNDELDANVSFSPDKIIADIEGRMYVIADNVLDGIMQFSKDGRFQRYTGTNDVTLNAWDIFWRNFATEAQLAAKDTLYNTTFASMVYFDSMIYTTSYSIKNSDGTINDKIMIKKINPSGDDTSRRNGYKVPMGDVKYVTTNMLGDDRAENKPSSFESITVNGYGVYSVVDSTKGRIFTYDNEGNLLYISGGKGIQADKLQLPVSIQYFGENLLVLDAANKTIIKFEPTEIASIINQAVREESKGRLSRLEPKFNQASKTWWIGDVDTKIGNETATFEEKDGKWFIGGQDTNIEAEPLAATDYWQKVVKLNANYEYAYVGIGHKHLKDENYKEAMKYFELGKNKVYYSKAFKQHRDAIIKEWFGPVVITIAVLLVGKAVYKTVRNKKLGIRKEEETGIGDE
jgi:hypothetical protein